MKKLFGRTYETPSKGHGKILVDSSLTGVPALSTLVHECCHHLNWGFSEVRVQHLEYAIVNMVLSNPHLFRELAEHSPE